MVVAKFFGIWLVTTVYQLPWTVQQAASEVILRPIVSSSDLVTISTYSDLILYFVMCIGMSWVLLQATHFHDTHISPQLLMKLSSNNLFGLIKSSYEIYHQAAVWTLFIWLASITIWINVALGKTVPWMGAITVIANVVFTIVLLHDVHREIDLSKRTLGQKEALQ